jgi:hypothetical protein
MKGQHQTVKTHCPRNHPYDATNTRWYTHPKTGRTQRVCKACAAEKSRRFRLNRYGISVEEWDTIFDRQGGLCAICKVNPIRDLDHDHKTGEVRGLLCNPCNQGLGLFNEDRNRLLAAVAYLASFAGDGDRPPG